MSTTVEIAERESGGYTAVDTTTGVAGTGETVADALEDLATLLRAIDRMDADDGTATERLRALSDRVQDRFEEEEITDEDIEDAIRWARSR